MINNLIIWQDCETAFYPIEFVNSCSISGVPDHILLLKPGAPYIIMRNTSPMLCNGTRVVFLRRVGKCLEVEIASGVHKGEIVFVPRMIFTSKTVSLPFTLKRIQYPLQSCFAMFVFICPLLCSLPHSLCRTVHKSQGQTLDRVGIYFAKDVWAHGLLYVAASRVRRTQDCFFLGAVGATVHNFCSLHLR